MTHKDDPLFFEISQEHRPGFGSRDLRIEILARESRFDADQFEDEIRTMLDRVCEWKDHNVSTWTDYDQDRTWFRMDSHVTDIDVRKTPPDKTLVEHVRHKMFFCIDNSDDPCSQQSEDQTEEFDFQKTVPKNGFDSIGGLWPDGKELYENVIVGSDVFNVRGEDDDVEDTLFDDFENKNMSSDPFRLPSNQDSVCEKGRQVGMDKAVTGSAIRMFRYKKLLEEVSKDAQKELLDNDNIKCSSSLQERMVDRKVKNHWVDQVSNRVDRKDEMEIGDTVSILGDTYQVMGTDIRTFDAQMEEKPNYFIVSRKREDQIIDLEGWKVTRSVVKGRDYIATKVEDV